MDTLRSYDLCSVKWRGLQVSHNQFVCPCAICLAPGMHIISLWSLCPLGLFIYAPACTDLLVLMCTCTPMLVDQAWPSCFISKLLWLSSGKFQQLRDCETKTDDARLWSLSSAVAVYIYRPSFFLRRQWLQWLHRTRHAHTHKVTDALYY